MPDHWMPGLFQTPLGQCLGSGWQVLHPLSAPVPFPPLGKDALSASSLPGQTPLLIHFAPRMPLPEHWLMLSPSRFQPIPTAEFSRAPPNHLPAAGGTAHLCRAPSTKPLQF